MLKTSRLGGSIKPMLITCLALFMAPSIAAITSSCFFAQIDTTVELTKLVGWGTSLEMMAAAFLAVGIGMVVYLIVAALSTNGPTLADMIAIELSQVLSFLISLAALVHNPQEEFCKPNPAGSALAKAFELGSCSLTMEFWKQAIVGGIVSAAFFVLALRIGRSIIRNILS